MQQSTSEINMPTDSKSKTFASVPTVSVDSASAGRRSGDSSLLTKVFFLLQGIANPWKDKWIRPV